MSSEDAAAVGTARRRRPTAFGVGIIAAVVFAELSAFVAVNDYELPDLGRVVWIALGATALSMAVWIVAVRVRPRLDVNRTAVAVAAVTWWWFSFDLVFRWWISDGARRVLQASLWLLVAVVLARLAYGLARHRVVRELALAVPVCMVVLQGFVIATYRVGVDDTPRPAVAGGEVATPVEDPPNIYWIVLDEHARADQLEAITGADPTGLDDELAAREFDVSRSSWSSYTRTAQSMASTLFADYVFQPGAGVENEYLVGGDALRGDNPTVDRLRGLGYRYVYAPAGTYQWSACTTPPADRCVDVPGGAFATDDLVSGIIAMTPLSQLRLFHSGSMDLATVAQAAEQEVASGGPFFLTAHVMSPHWPYRFDESCDERADPITPAGLPGVERAEHYVNEVRCLAPTVIDAVDRILAVDPDAVIVIQSDHGSGLTIDLFAPNADWGDDALTERLAVLNAMRLPEDCRGDDRYAVEGQPLVNTFRIVLACIEGRDPELLEHRAFLWPFNDLRGIEELDTARLVTEPTSG